MTAIAEPIAVWDTEIIEEITPPCETHEVPAKYVLHYFCEKCGPWHTLACTPHSVEWDRFSRDNIAFLVHVECKGGKAGYLGMEKL